MRYPLEEIRKISDELVELIKPYCKRIEVCGSIRRKCETCKDIDIVLIPNDLTNLKNFLSKICDIEKGGNKWISCRFKGIQVDIAICNERNYEVWRLVRTGSRNFNVKLIMKAKKLGYGFKLNFGLIKDGKVVDNTERGIIEKVFGRYIEPEDRSW